MFASLVNDKEIYVKELLLSDSYPAFFLLIATTSNKNFFKKRVLNTASPTPFTTIYSFQSNYSQNNILDSNSAHIINCTKKFKQFFYVNFFIVD